jgi:hypothetical protein
MKLLLLTACCFGCFFNSARNRTTNMSVRIVNATGLPLEGAIADLLHTSFQIN